MSKPLIGILMGFAERLRFPVLFSIIAGLWLLTLLVPDPLPMVDELLMGLLVLLLSRWRKPERPPTSGDASQARIIDGEARRER